MQAWPWCSRKSPNIRSFEARGKVYTKVTPDVSFTTLYPCVSTTQKLFADKANHINGIENFWNPFPAGHASVPERRPGAMCANLKVSPRSFLGYTKPT
jgi:hypothetical protein